MGEYANTDPKLYETYFNLIKTAGRLRYEEPVQTQDLYSEVTNVLQAVLTDRNADVAALMSRANDNFQLLLDSTINQ